MKDWVRPIGLAYRDGEPTELFECAACGKQVEFTVEPQAPPVRRIGGTMQPRCAKLTRSKQSRAQTEPESPRRQSGS